MSGLTDTEIMQEFEAAGAILKGHFVLSSGLHSDTYLQCARVMMDPARGERLCRALANKVRAELTAKIDMVASPAMGGVVVGYELARQLGVPAIFCERQEGKFTIRRGFSFPKGARILMVEDVVTTGKSSREAFECIREAGGEIIGEASLINRSGKPNPLDDVALVSLLALEVATYTQEQLPPHLESVPVEKPGSRFLKS